MFPLTSASAKRRGFPVENWNVRSVGEKYDGIQLSRHYLVDRVTDGGQVYNILQTRLYVRFFSDKNPEFMFYGQCALSMDSSSIGHRVLSVGYRIRHL